jgi:hypothetical protein
MMQESRKVSEKLGDDRVNRDMKKNRMRYQNNEKEE